MGRNSEGQIRYVAEQFHKTLTTRDIDGLMKLYHDDAVLESSAVLTIEGKRPGILHGKKEIRPHFEQFFELIGKDNPGWYHYTPYFTDGNRLVCEYPSKGPQGDQLDVVESFHLKDGLVAEHRVYWGFRGFDLLNGSTAE